MSNEQACMKALGSLDYGTAVTIGSYIGELVNELKQVKDAYEDRIGDIKYLEKEVDLAVSIFKDIQSIETWGEWDEVNLNQRTRDYIKGQEIVS